MAKQNTGEMLIDGKLHTLIGVAEYQHIIKEIPYNVELYVKKVNEGDISRDVLIQRTPYQWNNKMNSRMIVSILKNYQIGVILTACGRSESQCYTVNSLIDGLQRTTALVDYLDNKFALSSDTPPIECRWKSEDGNIIRHTFDISRKKFKDLPTVLQKRILEYKITTYSYENFSDDELDEIVFSTNNGKAPGAFHKLRFALGTENMRLIQPLCDYPLWEDVEKCSAKNDGILGCVIRTFMLMTGNCSGGLTTSAMAKFVPEFSSLVKTSKIKQVEKLIEQFGDIMDNMTSTELEALDGCSMPHFIASLKYYNNICEKNSIVNKSYLDFFRDFLKSKEYEDFSAYKAANDSGKKGAKSGSGGTQYSAESVDERQYIIDCYLEDFLDCPLKHNGAVKENTDDTDITDSADNAATMEFVEAVLNSD